MGYVFYIDAVEKRNIESGMCDEIIELNWSWSTRPW